MLRLAYGAAFGWAMACAPTPRVADAPNAVAAPGAQASKRASRVDVFEREISSYSHDYVERVSATQAWALREGPSAAARVIRVRLAHWGDAHLKAVVSSRLVELGLRYNGATVDLGHLRAAPALEVVVLNGSDVRNAETLTRLPKLRHLGFAATSGENVDLFALLPSLRSLETLELDADWLENTDTSTLGGWLGRAPRLRRVEIRVPAHLLSRPEARKRFDAKAIALEAARPGLTVRLLPQESDEGVEKNP